MDRSETDELLARKDLYPDYNFGAKTLRLQLICYSCPRHIERGYVRQFSGEGMALIAILTRLLGSSS